MRSSEQSCAVTGTSGYVGSRISKYFAARGWRVYEFTRRPGARQDPARMQVPFQLDSPVDPGAFRHNGIRVLIHCAYDFRVLHWTEIRRVNVEGSARLLRAAKGGGVDKIIFLSSISAFEGCRSLYGKAKLEIEKVAADLGATIIRPGLVYGSERPGGMYGSLQRVVARFPIMPLIGSGKHLQYLVHEDDLCELLLGFAAGR